MSASDGEVRIVRPVGGRLADEACAYTYNTHIILLSYTYVDSLASFVLIINRLNM